MDLPGVSVDIPCPTSGALVGGSEVASASTVPSTRHERDSAERGNYAARLLHSRRAFGVSVCSGSNRQYRLSRVAVAVEITNVIPPGVRVCTCCGRVASLLALWLGVQFAVKQIVPSDRRER